MVIKPLLPRDGGYLSSGLYSNVFTVIVVSKLFDNFKLRKEDEKKMNQLLHTLLLKCYRLVSTFSLSNASSLPILAFDITDFKTGWQKKDLKTKQLLFTALYNKYVIWMVMWMSVLSPISISLTLPLSASLQGEFPQKRENATSL